jgi:hypothetical protein
MTAFRRNGIKCPSTLWSHLNDPRRHPIPKSIIDTFEYLIKQGDRERMKAWLAERTEEERRHLRKLLEK